MAEETHRRHHLQRAERLDAGVYGVVRQPVIERGVCVHHDHPSYERSKRVSMYLRAVQRAPSEAHLLRALWQPDFRCFYLGLPTNLQSEQRPLKNPLKGTRDHLVPVRCTWDGRESPHGGRERSADTTGKVWSSMIANVTLGLAPLPVRLKIRQWLEDTPYDRDDTSIANGINCRWILIKYIEYFRIDGRLPWSRNSSGQYWYPQISEPYMARMFEIERHFLQLKERDRDSFIRDFHWLG